MAASVSSSPTCLVCFNVFQEPKLLECGHTFCLKCIKPILDGDSVRCPMCRKKTNVDEGDIGKLQTNLILSSIVDGMIHDVRNVCCTAVSQKRHDNPANFYCPDCGVFLCIRCEKVHHSWEPNRRHKIISIFEFQKKSYCPQYELGETESIVEYTQSVKQICVNCNKMLSSSIEEDAHVSKGHNIMRESSYKSYMEKNALDIQKNISATVGIIQTSRKVYSELESLVRSHSYDMIKNINATYNEGMRKLDEWKLAQTKRFQILQEMVSERYDYQDQKVNDCVQKLQRQGRILSTNLATSDNVTACAALCDDLSRILKTANEQKRDPKLEKGMTLAINSSIASNSITTANMTVNNWDVSKKPLVTTKSMTSVAVNIQTSQIAVSYFEGGVHWIIDKSRSHSPLYLTNIKALGIAFFSDGYIVVRDKQNQIKLFKSNMKPVEITFNTLPHKNRAQGGLAVDHDDNVYISYREPKIIQVFTRRGGEPMTEIACGICTPQQIAVISKRQLLVMDGQVVSIVDDLGAQKHEIRYAGCYGYPTVSRDGSVLIAWVDRRLGILRIDKYTSELKMIKCVYSSNRIQLSGRGWYYLRELPDGGLAFCTSSQLVILKPRICDHVQDVTTYFQDTSHTFSATV